MKPCRVLALLPLLALLASPARAEPPAPADVAPIMALGPNEHVFGAPDAKVTVIQYASLTCHNCRAFHMETWPEVRRRYVDTGKIRFVVREFPLDPVSAGAFMLARCSGAPKWAATVDLLYRTDERWAHAPDPVAGLHELMHENGMGSAAFEECLSDQALLDDINAIADRGAAAGVKATPTFVVDGKFAAGRLTIEEFAALVDPAIAAKP
ncbi:DsbA family protein [Hansschlegelia sp. KR7-227]|uniref:DsbA family protein n=1 Tax=Hansschlegelia sp. KR7-227 TaxID=3400914 RepID=UPI003C01F856